MNKIKFFIKDFWEDFRYMNEGFSHKYWINNVIWGVLFTFFIVTMFIAAILGGLFCNIRYRSNKNYRYGL